jgi:hypothetical protein
MLGGTGSDFGIGVSPLSARKIVAGTRMIGITMAMRSHVRIEKSGMEQNSMARIASPVLKKKSAGGAQW